MHNKLFVADNALAITGGRNIGDEYFTLDKHSNFIDLDVVVAGPIVAQLSASFDAFWNSKYAYPIASLASAEDTETAPQPQSNPVFDDDANWLEHELDAGKLQLDWVPATVLADRPAKIASETSPDEEVTIANNIAALMRSAQHELIVISPYFVPGKDGVALLRELVERGRAHPHTHQLAGLDRFAAGAQRLCALSRGAAQARRRALRGAAQARAKARALSSVSRAPTPACTPRRW